jgi:glycosyltransferase involved in cell wall biosynthesis
MRVLWFTNGPMPAFYRRRGYETGGSGYWMSSLLENLALVNGVHVDVAAAVPGQADDQFVDNGVGHYVIGQPKWESIFSCRQRDLTRCVEIVRETQPDIIHIHGTERLYGLMTARNLITAPCVISLQGLLGPYLSGFFGALSPAELWRSHRLIELATRRGLLWQFREFVVGARREHEIIAGAKSFMGRTDWDRAHVGSVNPEANYYHVGEVLRKQFSETLWNTSRCERHTIIFTNAGEPRRGTEVLLRAMLIIRREFPDSRLLLGGQIGSRRGYHRFLRHRIAVSGLLENIEFLGYLHGNAMAAQLSRAHVFAISSYIENSPNSLCEAMQVGLPCVATYVGGIPSLLHHGRTGLLFPPGDAPLLADAIMRIFRDDDLAGRLSRAARAEASERHAPQRVISQLLNCYHDVVANSREAYHVRTVSKT